MGVSWCIHNSVLRLSHAVKPVRTIRSHPKFSKFRCSPKSLPKVCRLPAEFGPCQVEVAACGWCRGVAGVSWSSPWGCFGDLRCFAQALALGSLLEKSTGNRGLRNSVFMKKRLSILPWQMVWRVGTRKMRPFFPHTGNSTTTSRISSLHQALWFWPVFFFVGELGSKRKAKTSQEAFWGDDEQLFSALVDHGKD